MDEISEVIDVTWVQEKYDWPDEKAKKLGFTKKQYQFVQAYLKSGNASQAIRETDWWGDTALASRMKNNTRINLYIQETAQECAEIQFNEIIRNPKAPMAVRNDAIKDRLNRAGVGVEKEEEKGNMFVGNMTIQIDNWIL